MAHFYDSWIMSHTVQSWIWGMVLNQIRKKLSLLFRNIMKLWCCMFSSWLKIVFNLISGLTSGFTFRWCFLNGNTLYYKTFITVYFGRQFCGLFQKESKTIPCTLETEHHLLIRNSSSLGRVMNHFFKSLLGTTHDHIGTTRDHQRRIW